jgi:hypothetical protein
MRRIGFSKISLLVLVVLVIFSGSMGLGMDQEIGQVDLSGSWSGHWANSNNCHTGPLHAHFCKSGENCYRVEFHGRFMKILPFRYSVVLTIKETKGDQVILEGESHLGRLFGTFTYTAQANDCDFVAHYSSCKYQGSFVLKRCGR